jgi:hypothetical protein
MMMAVILSASEESRLFIPPLEKRVSNKKL